MHKKRSAHIPRLSAVFILLAAGLFNGCSKPEFQSSWPKSTIAIDGRGPEWSGKLVDVDKGKASIGVMNDGEFLTLALVTGDDEIKRVLIRQGVIVWFDTSGGSGRLFGIRYPLGSGFRGERGMNLDRPMTVVDELEICGPGEGNRHRMTVAQAGGIAVKYQIEFDTLVYEMRVPLRDAGRHPFAINVSPGQTIGVGIETPGMDRADGIPQGRQREGMGGAEGTGGGRMGRGGGRGGRGGSPSGEEGRPEPFALWGRIHLAGADSLPTVKQH